MKITFAYTITMFFLISLILFFDMLLFHFGFMEAVKNLYYSEVTVGRLFEVTGLLIGFAFSITTDVRLLRNKKKGFAGEES